MIRKLNVIKRILQSKLCQSRRNITYTLSRSIREGKPWHTQSCMFFSFATRCKSLWSEYLWFFPHCWIVMQVIDVNCCSCSLWYKCACYFSIFLCHTRYKRSSRGAHTQCLCCIIVSLMTVVNSNKLQYYLFDDHIDVRYFTYLLKCRQNILMSITKNLKHLFSSFPLNVLQGEWYQWISLCIISLKSSNNDPYRVDS